MYLRVGQMSWLNCRTNVVRTKVAASGQEASLVDEDVLLIQLWVSAKKGSGLQLRYNPGMAQDDLCQIWGLTAQGPLNPLKIFSCAPIRHQPVRVPTSKSPRSKALLLRSQSKPPYQGCWNLWKHIKHHFCFYKLSSKLNISFFSKSLNIFSNSHFGCQTLYFNFFKLFWSFK
jgi:hypothetical protein